MLVETSQFKDQLWDHTLEETGVQIVDRTIRNDATWDEILQSGREEWDAAQAVCHLQTGNHRCLLDLGCGIGRVSYALADIFGEVVGVDISQSLLRMAIERNNRPNLRFELLTEARLQPDRNSVYDAVFADEVFHYLDWETLSRYSEDAYRLLRTGGEFAFQLNLHPIHWRTKVSWAFRSFLYRIGIKRWRNWSTSPSLIRYYHAPHKILKMLRSIGFDTIRIGIGQSPKQSWFVATKPLIAN